MIIAIWSAYNSGTTSGYIISKSSENLSEAKENDVKLRISVIKIEFEFWDPVMPKLASPLKLYRDEQIIRKCLLT